MINLDNLWQHLLLFWILLYLNKDINKQTNIESKKSNIKDSKKPKNKYFWEYLYTEQKADI